MNGQEVKALRDDEITIELGRLREKQYRLRTQAITDKIEDNSQFKKLRKDIARLNGEARRRELETQANA
ncbi:MAG: 50S ribosomal protein L29 [Planctomycetota bacterium]